MVKTDLCALYEKFDRIPTPADAHDEAVLNQALLDALRSLAIRENDGSPEHNFFIGLAYDWVARFFQRSL